MAQSSIALRTTPPYPGLQLVQDINSALQSLGTDFAGPSDPAAFAGAFMTWADTASGQRKRRNAANTAWVTEGSIFRQHLAVFAQNEIPTTNVGAIYVQGIGSMVWDGTRYITDGVVGTVAQAGGAPTGAVLQSGSTANGQFIRYADGTQICSTLFTPPNIPSFGVQQNTTLSASPRPWAAAFTAIHHLSANYTGAFANIVKPFVVDYTNTTTGTVALQNLGTLAATLNPSTGFVHVMAMGRWF